MVFGLMQEEGEQTMERRIIERRGFHSTPDFPLVTPSGEIVEDRRRQPDRRLNSIEVAYLVFPAEAVQCA
jgi:hypothetical protein